MAQPNTAFVKNSAAVHKYVSPQTNKSGAVLLGRMCILDLGKLHRGCTVQGYAACRECVCSLCANIQRGWSQHQSSVKTQIPDCFGIYVPARQIAQSRM